MREVASLLKTDLQEEKKLEVIDQFLLKLPGVESHEFHTTQGEVCY
jgi:hypothetical protein